MPEPYHLFNGLIMFATCLLHRNTMSEVAKHHTNIYVCIYRYKNIHINKIIYIYNTSSISEFHSIFCYQNISQLITQTQLGTVRVYCNACHGHQTEGSWGQTLRFYMRTSVVALVSCAPFLLKSWDFSFIIKTNFMILCCCIQCFNSFFWERIFFPLFKKKVRLFLSLSYKTTTF